MQFKHGKVVVQRLAARRPWPARRSMRRTCTDTTVLVAGPLTRIGPNDLVTSDAEALRRMWAVRSPYKKGSFYDAIRFDPARPNLISMRDDREHETLRAKMASGVSMNLTPHALCSTRR
jgi:hypothetical protein